MEFRTMRERAALLTEQSLDDYMNIILTINKTFNYNLYQSLKKRGADPVEYYLIKFKNAYPDLSDRKLKKITEYGIKTLCDQFRNIIEYDYYTMKCKEEMIDGTIVQHDFINLSNINKLIFIKPITICSVCFNEIESKNKCVLGCGHMNTCYTCVKKLQSKKCPLCTTYISTIIYPFYDNDSFIN